MGPKDKQYITSDQRPLDDWREATKSEGAREEGLGNEDCRDWDAIDDAADQGYDGSE
ncbi:hypothetical protein GTO10_03835 [Candidatus Saccharibacteria bacterium]|nr:hypothetical protein [Candidatus Saccharibacteria bacterium]